MALRFVGGSIAGARRLATGLRGLFGRAAFLLDAPAARFGRVDLRLHGGAHVLGVLRRLAAGGQFFLLLARALKRGRDDRAFLRFGIVGGRGGARCGRGRRGRGRRGGRGGLRGLRRAG
ncbi:hypothetical protein F3J18_34350, partial [Burkholderia sp. Ax-1720]|nr:hypothetical protein [Burkholderia sp. Ax-1720]